MKAQYNILIISILTALLVQCGSVSNKTKIGLCMDAFDQERWQKDRDYLLKGLKDNGFDVLMEAAQSDANLQVEQAKKLIQEGIKVLIIIPSDSKKAAEIVEIAHKANVKVVAYDRLIKNCELDYYISTDNVSIGSLQANYMLSLKPAGKYVLIGGATTDNNSFLIRLGQLDVLQPLVDKGDIKIVFDQFCDEWKVEEGSRMMEDAINQAGKDIDAVLCANDDLAQGVIKVLEKYNLIQKVLVAGQDADLNACRMIVDGKQAITIYKPIKLMAHSTVDLVQKLLADSTSVSTTVNVNNSTKMVPTILLTPMVVNQQNIRLTVVADGYLTENQIYK